MAPMKKAEHNKMPTDRMNLRLPLEVFARIDQARALRPGFVSRNTWIAEAIQENLRRELGRGSGLPKATIGDSL